MIRCNCAVLLSNAFLKAGTKVDFVIITLNSGCTIRYRSILRSFLILDVVKIIRHSFIVNVQWIRSTDLSFLLLVHLLQYKSTLCQHEVPYLSKGFKIVCTWLRIKNFSYVSAPVQSRLPEIRSFRVIGSTKTLIINFRILIPFLMPMKAFNVFC